MESVLTKSRRREMWGYLLIPFGYWTLQCKYPPYLPSSVEMFAYIEDLLPKERFLLRNTVLLELDLHAHFRVFCMQINLFKETELGRKVKLVFKEIARKIQPWLWLAHGKNCIFSLTYLIQQWSYYSNLYWLTVPLSLNLPPSW